MIVYNKPLNSFMKIINAVRYLKIINSYIIYMSNYLGLYLQKQVQIYYNNDFEKINLFKYYQPNEIALLSIGIWSGHSCYSATERIHKLAADANIFIEKMRNHGCHIIHGGSYSNYSCPTGDWSTSNLRKNIKNLPMIKLKDKGINIPQLPIDDSDGGYKPEDKNKEYDKSTISIHPSIKINYEKDCISDNSKEILNYLFHHKIKVIIAFGTHTNMCVLDKPYGIKHYIRYGFPVIVARDLCDSMYNPEMSPYVSQPESNNIMIDWFEKNICPTINSKEIINLNKKVIFVDIDKTITNTNVYESTEVKTDVIEKINTLYLNGYNIIYWTARGNIKSRDWYDFTKKQLDNWGCKYNLLITKKHYFDYFIDDKSINLDVTDDFLNIIN